MKTHLQFYTDVDNLLSTSFGDKAFADRLTLKVAALASFGVTPEDNVTAAPVNLEAMVVSKATVHVSGFQFGVASEKEFVGVDPRLVKCARIALGYSTQDYCCYDGIRTYKEQAQHVKDGTSKTMESKHLQGLAVDLVPWINGKPVWDWEGCYRIAVAMDKAATELGIANLITWGGAWDRRLSDFGGDAKAYEAEVQAYRARHPGKDFIDGPHYEILP